MERAAILYPMAAGTYLPTWYDWRTSALADVSSLTQEVMVSRVTVMESPGCFGVGVMSWTRLLCERLQSRTYHSDYATDNSLCVRSLGVSVCVLQLLVQHNGDPDSRDLDHVSPIMLAAQEGHQEVRGPTGSEVEDPLSRGGRRLSTAAHHAGLARGTPGGEERRGLD